jgi:hypothetical protein
VHPDQHLSRRRGRIGQLTQLHPINPAQLSGQRYPHHVPSQVAVAVAS